MKKISVIVPTYNGGNTIENCIKSILKQKGNFKLELLICDDCSTDDTLEIVNKYPCNVFINDTNSGGPNKGRNVGIKNATGDYIAFLDQDDEWMDNKLKIQLPIIENADVVYSLYKGENKKPSKYLYQTLLKRDFNYGWAYLGSLLIRNNDIPLFEEYFGQLDYDWMLKLTKHRLCVQTEPVVIRNITDKNLSKNKEYRKRDFYMGLLLIDGDISTMKKWFGSRARYHYVMNEMKLARFYFFRSNITWKTILYFITSYHYMLSRYVVKKFKVSG